MDNKYALFGNDDYNYIIPKLYNYNVIVTDDILPYITKLKSIKNTSLFIQYPSSNINYIIDNIVKLHKSNKLIIIWTTEDNTLELPYIWKYDQGTILKHINNINHKYGCAQGHIFLLSCKNNKFIDILNNILMHNETINIYELMIKLNMQVLKQYNQTVLLLSNIDFSIYELQQEQLYN